MTVALAILSSVSWGGVAFYQTWRDWRDRLLPPGPSLLAVAITWLTGWSGWHWSSAIFLHHVEAGLGLGVLWAPLWWWGGLGLGDLGTAIALGLSLGTLPAFAALGMGLVATLIGWGSLRGVRAITGRSRIETPQSDGTPPLIPLGRASGWQGGGVAVVGMDS